MQHLPKYKLWKVLHWCAERAYVNGRCLPIGKLAVFFSHAILVAENKLRVCLINIEGVFYESEYTPAFNGSEGRCPAG